jgi:PAS domain S-box-containing protein
MNNHQKTKEELIQELRELQQENNRISSLNAISKAEREEAEKALRVSEERFRTLFERTVNGVRIVNQEGFIIEENRAMSEITGIPNEQTIARPIWDILFRQTPFASQTPETYSRIKEAIAKILREGRFPENWITLTNNLQSADGSLKTVKSNYFSVKTPYETLFYAIVHDVTDIVKAHDELLAAKTEIEKSEETYRKDLILLHSIFESPMDIIIFALDTNYCYTAFTKFHSQTIKKIWGVDIQIGMNMLDVILRPDDREKAKKNFDRVLNGEKFILTEEYGDQERYRTFYDNHYSCIKNSDGQVVGISVFVIDVTQRRQAEISINQLNETLEDRIAERTNELELKMKEIEQFTYIASHDLQEPLRTMITLTRLLQEENAGKLNEDGNKSIELISNSAIRMNELVKGLLDYSFLGQERVLTKVDCSKIVGEVLSDMADSIRISQAKITLCELPFVDGYATELRLLFQNLINNSIKFRSKEKFPEIKISAGDREKDYIFTIEDNGIGIQASDKEKIFIIFKRTHNRNEYEGTGIGLAHCKKIVKLHGGKIWVESTPGIGSAFSFTIPKQ